MSALTIAVFAHTAAGGRLPAAVFMLPVALPVVFFAYLASDRLIGRRTALVLQTIVQLALHQAFSVLGGHQGTGRQPASWLDLLFVQGPSHQALLSHPGLGGPDASVLLLLQFAAMGLSVAALEGAERVVRQAWGMLLPLILLVVRMLWVVNTLRRSILEAAQLVSALVWSGRRRRRRGPPVALLPILPI